MPDAFNQKGEPGNQAFLFVRLPRDSTEDRVQIPQILPC
jgi:hypothetical protein